MREEDEFRLAFAVILVLFGVVLGWILALIFLEPWGCEMRNVIP